jgi:hypothetical protein
MAPKKESELPGAPRTTPGTDPPEKRPGPFAQNPSQAPLRTPPTKEQRERDEEDDKMDAVMRDTPL